MINIKLATLNQDRNMLPFTTSKSNNLNFTVSSGILRVTDPCYSIDTWCSGQIGPVKNGAWLAQVGYLNEIVAYLRVCHKSERSALEAKTTDTVSFKKTQIIVGVDSAQCGFFDLQRLTDVLADKSRNDTFYQTMCNLTLGEQLFGVNTFGAVSMSGYGDGTYSCYIRSVNGEIVDSFINYTG